MAYLDEYRITFGYGEKDGKYYGPNGSIGPFHKGDDYPTPVGVLVRVGGSVIGVTGATGVVSDPHCHVQEWSGNTGNTRKPQNTFRPGGTISAVATGSQWGKYVSVTYSDGWTTTYAHLSEQRAAVGQKIGDNMPTITDEGLSKTLCVMGYGSESGWQANVGKDISEVIRAINGSIQRENYLKSMRESATLDVVRIMHSEVFGWDVDQVHAGKLDNTIKGYVGQDTNQMLRDAFAFKDAAAYRTNKAQWKKFYDKYYDSLPDILNQLAELQSQPPRVEFVEKIVEKEVPAQVTWKDVLEFARVQIRSFLKLKKDS